MRERERETVTFINLYLGKITIKNNYPLPYFPPGLRESDREEDVDDVGRMERLKM